jgi:uncharacterized surface protein with fasciclin (FAS1) repeats
MKMKIFKRPKWSLLFVVVLLLASIACQKKKWDEYFSNPTDRKGPGVLKTIEANPDYSEFVSLLKIAGLDSILSSTGQFTVLPVKNGALGSIDKNNKVQVKKIMDMHVLPIAIYSSKMNMFRTKTLAGKYEIFDNGKVLITVGAANESIMIVNADKKVSDGVIHEVERYIIPWDNLLDALAGNSDYSQFYNYIMSTRAKLLDMKQSKIIGYDTLSQPVYDSVFTYRYGFFDQANIADESGAFTMFIPNNDLVNHVLTSDINSSWGGVFPYSSFFASMIKDRLFKSCIVPGIYKMDDLSSVNKLKTVSGVTLNISKSQIGLADQKVSNGIFHVLTDITIPDYVVQVPVVTDGYISYPTRNKDSFKPFEMPLANFADGSSVLSQQVRNSNNVWYAYPYYFFNTATPPVIQYRANLGIDGTSSFWYPYNFVYLSSTVNTAATTGTAITFTLPAKYSAMSTNANSFSTVTYRIDFVSTPGTSKVVINSFSSLPRGWYKIIFNTADSDNSGVFDIYYGTTLLLKDYNASNPLRNRPISRQQISLGPVYNPAYGKISLTIILSRSGLNNQFQLELDAILFTAVPEP